MVKLAEHLKHRGPLDRAVRSFYADLTGSLQNVGEKPGVSVSNLAPHERRGWQPDVDTEGKVLTGAVLIKSRKP